MATIAFSTERSAEAVQKQETNPIKASNLPIVTLPTSFVRGEIRKAGGTLNSASAVFMTIRGKAFNPKNANKLEKQQMAFLECVSLISKGKPDPKNPKSSIPLNAKDLKNALTQLNKLLSNLHQTTTTIANLPKDAPADNEDSIGHLLLSAKLLLSLDKYKGLSVGNKVLDKFFSRVLDSYNFDKPFSHSLVEFQYPLDNFKNDYNAFQPVQVSSKGNTITSLVGKTLKALGVALLLGTAAYAGSGFLGTQTNPISGSAGSLTNSTGTGLTGTGLTGFTPPAGTYTSPLTGSYFDLGRIQLSPIKIASSGSFDPIVNPTSTSSTTDPISTASSTGAADLSSTGSSSSSSTTGSVGTSTGVDASTASTTGSAITASTTGSVDTSTGVDASTASTTGSAITSSTTGSVDTSTGVDASTASTTGSALTASTTGSVDTSTGVDASTASTTGSAITSSTTGSVDTSTGVDASTASTTGSALTASTTGSVDTSTGVDASTASTTGPVDTSSTGVADPTSSSTDPDDIDDTAATGGTGSSSGIMTDEEMEEMRLNAERLKEQEGSAVPMTAFTVLTGIFVGLANLRNQMV